MRAGELRHTVEIQEKVFSTGTMQATGKVEWVTIERVKAAIWPLRGTELAAYEKPEGRVTHKLRIRYSDQINIKHRLKYHDAKKDTDRNFNIQSIINVDERNIFQELMAEEIV